MIRTVRIGSVLAAALLVAWAPAQATDQKAADESPGLDALEQFREGKGRPRAIENRFFLKQNRFELSPSIGYVPNNPMARRYVGSVLAGFHFTETLAMHASFSYSPDLGENDLKGLVPVLLDRAHQAGEVSGDDATASFQQPLDKVVIAFSTGVSWAPLYGKINLVGETVLNFDLYGFLGVGMVSKQNYVATYDEQTNPDDPQADVVVLTEQGNEVKIGPVIAVGTNYFLNQMMALKIDARSSFYVDLKPQYDPNEPVTEQRLYNNFTASVGLGFFFPRMKPRLYDF